VSDDLIDSPVETDAEAESLIPDLQLPDDPAAAVQVLASALDEAWKSEATHLDDLRRVAAEFDNFRKRSMRDQQEMTERASQRVVEALLPVLDSFDGAFSHEAQSPSEESLLAGVQSTFHQLMEVLSGEGLAAIATDGETFDPTVHEAVAGGGGDDLVITSELRRGYTMQDRVIRPALVAVAPRHQEGHEEEGPDQE
jgi:molecular chaperone GrpE